MGKQYVVEQGDTFPDVARRHGFPDWKAVWKDPANKALRDKRKNPRILFPGDRISLPDLQAKAVSRPTGGESRFEVQTGRTVLRLRLADAEGKSLGDAAYRLTFAGNAPLQGRTQGDGTLEHDVPPSVTGALLETEQGARSLRFNRLTPLEQTPDDGVSGAQARLANLGYALGEPTGTLDVATRVALATFQADHGLPVDGKLTPATRSKLEEMHGC